MKLLDGKMVAQNRRQNLQKQIATNLSQGKRHPKLVVIMVGHNEASEVYVKHKIKAAKEVGIVGEVHHFASDVEPNELYQAIETLNNDSEVDGILLQLPLPPKFNEEDYLQAIAPHKDVDGFHYQNQGRLLQGYETIAPCTPLGVINLLDSYEIPIKGQNVTIIGTSNIVGKPLGIMLLNLGATVTFCNRNTKDLKMMAQTADILVSGTGQQFIITGDMVKLGSVVIDIGIIRNPKTNRLVGDVDFEAVAPKTSYITPVPGGVGPMTVVTLLENTYKLYLQHLS
ncbi:methylenetetrahydrofolate dehydrogenase (NADP+)/methenyltetrahydrofolate cyclohydrolase [Entomoplasma freundtii]|uniref:Bifunctional protein FolD n=1 Tax=Entomoplasma freundtii TaxID=74700 RepID=A0A2K8NS06_9MOLU|nr:bifunctional 5,10-methylenetetrahydrofolate dehydrogenase/5,10-methenyltetrahydrofolate cyclohydrolase [Entomoplasma freundtii]ATZ16620.1 methylenetetrahydrofolate dehydrogenase/methylenetetrahydrofolate cyclohydrolase [Entomoplasma freundtii]TDY58213.1 methylenetetrahydrofolate dehydrogenase (NADP+)/methenyltetrahydrofolate cyclohydrolase [Entomoplasma freundtii]